MTADLDRWRQIAKKRGVLLLPTFDPSEQRWNDAVLSAILECVAEAVAAERERILDLCARDLGATAQEIIAEIIRAQPDPQPKGE